MTINGLIPHSVEGRFAGRVRVTGRDTRETPVAELATVVGMVFQNPEERISQLTVEDEIAMEAVVNLNRRLGMTIILAEHNLDEAAHLATRVVVLDRGRVVLDGEPRAVLSNYASDLDALGVGVPQLAEASLRLGLKEVALTPEELAPAFRKWADRHRKASGKEAGNGQNGTAVEARGLGYTALRFVPLVQANLLWILDAQRVRGIRTSSLRGMGMLLSTLLIVTLRTAVVKPCGLCSG